LAGALRAGALATALTAGLRAAAFLAGALAFAGAFATAFTGALAAAFVGVFAFAVIFAICVLSDLRSNQLELEKACRYSQFLLTIKFNSIPSRLINLADLLRKILIFRTFS
jgi:hypothetical protein